jgi:hypothetical protein
MYKNVMTMILSEHGVLCNMVVDNGGWEDVAMNLEVKSAKVAFHEVQTCRSQ